MPRNPNWTRDEIILALNLYAQVKYSSVGENDSRVAALSKELNRLPIHALSVRDKKFRNPNGIGKKLGNFAAIDPSYSGKGLAARSHLDDEVWNEFWHDKKRLRETAQRIREHYRQFPVPHTRQEQTDHWDDEEEFAEGRILTRVHKQRERNPSLIRKKKEQVLAKTGRLACEVCGFDFKATYGELGKDFAECHHNVPVAKLTPKSKTKLTDLSLVCANCHRMLHRRHRQITINQLKDMIECNS